MKIGVTKFLYIVWRRKFNMFILLFCIIIVAIFLGKTLFPQTEQIIYGGDLLTQFYFWKGYLAENLRQGIIPFWNPYNFSGTPFLAHPAVAAFYPATLLYLTLPLNIAFSWNYFLHLLIGGWGMYRLSRLYADKISALFSCLAFVLSGYFAARIYAGHVDLLTTAIWLPWVFYSFKRAFDDPSKINIILSIAFLSLEILAGYQAYVIFTFEFLLIYFLYRVFIAKDFRRKTSYSKIILFIGVIVTSIAITAVQWLPTWQLARFSIRGQGMPYDLASWGSLPLSAIRLFVDPLNRTELDKIVFNLGGGPLPNPFDHFIGRIPLVIIFLFLVIKISRIFIKKLKEFTSINKDFWFFLIVCLFFLGISFGTYLTPNLHKIFYIILPFYKFIRIPLQHLVIIVFLVPLMAGMCLAVVRNKFIKIFLIGLVVLELMSFGKRYIFLTELPEKKYDSKLISFLQKELNGERLLPLYRVISPVLNDFDLNAPMKYKIRTTSGYDPVILKDYYHFIDLINKNSGNSLLYYNVEIPPIVIQGLLRSDFLNVKYILVDKSNDLLYPGDARFSQLELEGERYRLYKNQNKSSRFFLLDSAQMYRYTRQIEEALLSPIPPDLTFTATLFSAEDITDYIGDVNFNIDCSESEKGKVEVLTYLANRIELNVNTSCDRFLSTSEVYYPGWRAKIDGKDTILFRSNIAFRSVYVPEGNHKIEMYYRPDIYYMGGGITLIAGLFIAYFWKSKNLVQLFE